MVNTVHFPELSLWAEEYPKQQIVIHGTAKFSVQKDDEDGVLDNSMTENEKHPTLIFFRNYG